MTDVIDSHLIDSHLDVTEARQMTSGPGPNPAALDLETLLRRGQTRMIEERLEQAEMTGSLEGYVPRSPDALFYLLMMQFAGRPLVSPERVSLSDFSAEQQKRMAHAAQAAFLGAQEFEAVVAADPANEEPLRATRAGFTDMLAKASALPAAASQIQ